MKTEQDQDIRARFKSQQARFKLRFEGDLGRLLPHLFGRRIGLKPASDKTDRGKPD